MGKTVSILGLIIMIVAGGALVLGFVNVLPAPSYVEENQPANFSGSDTTIPLFTSNQVSYNPIYNEIKVELFIINSDINNDAEFSITVLISEGGW